jgi:hypothetical protein
MSATRFRKPVVGQAESLSGGQPRSHSDWRLRRLAAAALVAGAWSAALLIMDASTSNPRLVSRDQVDASEVIVIGRLSRPAENRVRVERVFRGDLTEGDELRVANLADVPVMADGRSHLMPLSAFRGDFVVTTLEGQKAPPLVYDPSPEMIDQVKAILRDHL